MDKIECKHWRDYQRAAWPEWSSRFDRMKQDVQQMAVERIERELREVSLEDAKAATDEMMLQDIKPALVDVVRTIGALAAQRHQSRQRFSPRVFNGERTYKCRWCHDTGTVEFFNGSCKQRRAGIDDRYGIINRTDEHGRELLIDHREVMYKQKFCTRCFCKQDIGDGLRRRYESVFDSMVLGTGRVWSELTDKEQMQVLEGEKEIAWTTDPGPEDF